MIRWYVVLPTIVMAFLLGSIVADAFFTRVLLFLMKRAPRWIRCEMRHAFLEQTEARIAYLVMDARSSGDLDEPQVQEMIFAACRRGYDAGAAAGGESS